MLGYLLLRTVRADELSSYAIKNMYTHKEYIIID